MSEESTIRPRANPQRRGAHLDTREFLMPDGRPATIHRSSVYFCIQAKEAGRTIVGLKGAASAMPLMVDYAEFRQWWQAKS
jgi:hypothetical protein